MSSPIVVEAARRQACESLEAEFKAIHGEGSLGKDFPAAGNSGAREAALREKCHALQDEGQSALCLSGGGIRSATFCLGVLQGLCEAGFLGTFHYLSTVSGGGYIGSWLTAWQRRAGLPTVLDALARSAGMPQAAAAGAPPQASAIEPRPIRRLRAYSNYLSPAVGLGGDLFALVGTFVRNLFLHWLAIVPLLVATLLVPRLHVGLLWLDGSLRVPAFVPDTLKVPWTNSSLQIAAWMQRLVMHFNGTVVGPLGPLFIGGWAIALVVVALAYIASDLPDEKSRVANEHQTESRFVVWCLLPLSVAALMLSWLGAWARPASAFTRQWLEWYAVYSAPAIFGLLWVCTALYAGIVSKWRGEDGREWWARAGGYWLVAAIAWAALCVLVLHAPRWVLAIPALQSVPGSATVGATALLGVVSSLWGYWGKYRTALREGARTIADRLGTRVLDLLALGFMLLLCLSLNLGISALLHRVDRDWLDPEVDAALKVEDAAYRNELACAAGCSACVPEGCNKAAPQLPVARKLSITYGVVVHEVRLRWLALAFVGLLVVGVFMWRCIGGNTFSLHAMYCNRLVRAYLGASTDQGAGQALVERRPHGFTGFDPADNLPLAPEEESKGWRLFPVINSTLNLVKAAGDRLEWQQRKADAFTLSPLCCGSPRLGYRSTASYELATRTGGPGITLGRAMAVSGAAASPNMGYHSSTPVALVMFFFNVRLGWWMRNPGVSDDNVKRQGLGSLRLLAAEALGRTTEDESYVYLSDGGHFENLGLYEMVRRRCRRIVVVDAAHDPDYGYEDLANCVRKVRVDFGVPIEFNDGLPTAASCRRTRLPFALGRVRYGAVDGTGAKDGTIVYLKPALCGDEPPDVADYAQRSRRGSTAFPQQPTADQFFDEAQFESYRILGLETARKVFWAGWPPRPDWPGMSPRHGPLGSNAMGGESSPIGPPLGQPGTAAAAAPAAYRLSNLGDATKWALVAAGTAAIVVTGTVTLKNTELKLGSESVQELRQIQGSLGAQVAQLREAVTGLSATIDPQAPASVASAAQPAASAASGLHQAVRDLSAAIRSASAPASGASAPADADLDRRVRALEDLAKALDLRVKDLERSAPLASDLRKASEQLAAAAQALRQAIEKLPVTPARPASTAVEVTLKPDKALSDYLGDIKAALERVEAQLQGIPPRRNIRSTTEGGRQ